MSALLSDGVHVLHNDNSLNLNETSRENGLHDGDVLQLHGSQRGSGPGESASPHPSNRAIGRGCNAATRAAVAAVSGAAATSSTAANSTATAASDDESDLDVDAALELEAAIQAEQEAAPAPNGESATGGAASQGVQPPPPSQQTAALARPLVADHEWQHVVVPDAQFMPPIRGTKVPYTPAGASGAVEVDIEPEQNSEFLGNHGKILVAAPWMGAGKTTEKRRYQMDLIRETPTLRTLDLDCNRLYSMSNAANQQETAAKLRTEPGLSHVRAAGYLDDNPTEPLSAFQMVNCSFESALKLEDQAFGLVVLDEASALALKTGGGTMPHFECVAVLREVLAQPGTRVLVLDAAAHFKMSDTEPCTVVEHFLNLVAPRRNVLSVALDPANMPVHLHRRLRVYFGADKAQTQLFWQQLESAMAAWQADNSKLILFAVGTKAIGRKEVAARLKAKGVPYEFYHGDSNVPKRFRDLADPGTWWANLGAVVFTTVVGRGIDLPGPDDNRAPLNVSRMFVAFDRTGCDFGDLFQSMLRARHVQNATIEVLLVRTMEPEKRKQLVREGKRPPLRCPTYEQVLRCQKERRGWALRAAERQACAAGVMRSSTSASDALLRVIAHRELNRKMQCVDPVYVVQRYADYYRMLIECVAPPAPQAAAAGTLQLDEDDAFDVNASPKEKWAIVIRSIRERGELDFLNEKCWDLATPAKGKATGENALTALQLWQVKAYHMFKCFGELPERQQPAGAEDGGEEGGGEDGGGGDGGGGAEDGGEEGGGEEGGGEDGGGGAEGGGEEGGGEDGGGGAEDESDPATEMLFTLLGNGSENQNQMPALELQAHCRVRTPEEQMRQDEARKLESARGKPTNHEHCKYGLGQKMELVGRLGKLLLRTGYRHVRQVFDPDGGGIVANANAELVAASNRQILKQMTDEDKELLQQLKQIADQLEVTGKKRTIIEVLKGLGKAMGLKLEHKFEQLRQPNGKRPKLVRADPGLRFVIERVLAEKVDKYLIWSPAHGTKVSVADWQHARIEQQLERVEDSAATDDHDYGDLFNAPFRRPADSTTSTIGAGGADVRVERIDDRALQHELDRLQSQYNGSAWMERVAKPTRDAWGADQQAEYARHLRCSSALTFTKAYDREAGLPDERGVRAHHVVYGKNSYGLGRRTASAPSMQHCQKELRRALCRERYHDVDMVSCHPTLMLQVVGKLAHDGVLQWSDALNKLEEYAKLSPKPTTLNPDNCEPTGRMPMLLRIAKYFGIDESAAKDVAKTLVLRVLNGGSVTEWCREVGIGRDACEGPIDRQADLRDLTEAARLVREAFFAMLERDQPGALARLKERVWVVLQDRHRWRVRNAQLARECLPQPPSTASRDRTMFSHIMFDLEDRVLDCIDRKLRELGWTVASLIYDGVRCRHPTAPPPLASDRHPRLLPPLHSLTPRLPFARAAAR